MCQSGGFESVTGNDDRQKRTGAPESDNSLFTSAMADQGSSTRNLRPQLSMNNQVSKADIEVPLSPGQPSGTPVTGPVDNNGKQWRQHWGDTSGFHPGEPPIGGWPFPEKNIPNGDTGSESANDAPSDPSAQLAHDILDKDLTTRTEASFKDAVNAYKALERKHDDAAQSELNAWEKQQDQLNPLKCDRGLAIITQGIGEYKLDAGSTFNMGGNNNADTSIITPLPSDNTKPILAGLKYDFGGEATAYLRASSEALKNAQIYVSGHRGQVVDGQPLDSNYQQQLQKLEGQVDNDLNAVYGYGQKPHNIRDVFDVIKQNIEQDQVGSWKSLVTLSEQYQANQGTEANRDNRYMAKQARDLAIGYLAEGEMRDFVDDGKAFYQKAVTRLQDSMQRDPDSPDNALLEQLLVEEKDKVGKHVPTWNQVPKGQPNTDSPTADSPTDQPNQNQPNIEPPTGDLFP